MLDRNLLNTNSSSDISISYSSPLNVGYPWFFVKLDENLYENDKLSSDCNDLTLRKLSILVNNGILTHFSLRKEKDHTSYVLSAI